MGVVVDIGVGVESGVGTAVAVQTAAKMMVHGRGGEVKRKEGS